jgi:hypothetical protein
LQEIKDFVLVLKRTVNDSNWVIKKAMWLKDILDEYYDLKFKFEGMYVL